MTTTNFKSDSELREELVIENVAVYRNTIRKFVISRLHHDHPFARRTPRISATALLFTAVETLLGYLDKSEVIAFLRQTATDLENGEGQVFEPITLPPKRNAK